MKKETKSVRELINQYQENCDKILSIADNCEKEERERDEKEEREYTLLVRDNQMLQMRMQIATSKHLDEHPEAQEEAEKIIRENAQNGRKTEILLCRDIMTVSDIITGSVVPLKIQDILKPLQEGFILDKVGLPMPTGCSGDFVWPVYEMVSASVQGEGVALSDTKIPFSKLTASPERVGIAIPVSNQSLNQSEGILRTVVTEIMPMSIRVLLNKILFSTTKVNNSTNLVGPFVDKVATAATLNNVPTFVQLNKDMKAKVLESGIDGEHMCWTMTKSMQAILEGTPINDKGIFIPMIQNDILAGLPIYTTNCMRDTVVSYQKYTAATSKWAEYTLLENDKVDYEVTGDTLAHALAGVTTPDDAKIAKVAVFTEYIGIGDWRYQPMGLFGTLRFIVDPYSQARKDAVDFVLNADYATRSLRSDAFKLGKVSASA